MVLYTDKQTLEDLNIFGKQGSDFCLCYLSTGLLPGRRLDPGRNVSLSLIG